MGVAVAGMGCVSAAGVGVEALLGALRRGETLCRPDALSRAYGTCVGALPLTNDQMRARLSPLGHEATRARSRTTLLALLAAHEALDNAQANGYGLPPEVRGRMAFVSATTVGGMDRTPLYMRDRAEGRRPRLRDIDEHEPAAHAQIVARALALGGFQGCISTACSSSANAIILGARLIERGLADAALCGGADALCPYVLSGFDSLKLLSGQPPHPLSEERDGLNLGEGAAYVLLVKASDAPADYPRLVGYGTSCEAYHHTAMSAEGRGCQAAVREALRRADLATRDVAYINLHGTATPNNDASEVSALTAAWTSEALPPLGSTKGLTGHTLGAAGALESVVCLLALRERTAWGNTGLLTPLEAVRESVSSQPRPLPEAAPRVALSTALGFGGNCTALMFRD